MVGLLRRSMEGGWTFERKYGRCGWTLRGSMEGGLTFERKYGGWLDICEEVWKVVGLLYILQFGYYCQIPV